MLQLFRKPIRKIVAGILIIAFPIGSVAQVSNHSMLLKISESWHKDAGGDLNGDGQTDIKDLYQLAQNWSPQSPITPTPTPGPANTLTQWVDSSPYRNEEGVAVTRETILNFSQPLEASTVNDTAFIASFAGEKLHYQLHLSPDKKTVTLFYNQPLPPSALIRVTLNGDVLKDNNQNLVDADGNNIPGGIAALDFSTLSLTQFPNTVVFGRVFASELNPSPDGELSVNKPLAGVTITVDGREESLRTVTDEFGSFRLENAPAGTFFVHVDGRTARADAPAGSYYPFVGKPWESIPGEETNVGDVYLPLVREGTLKPVSQTQDTIVSFPPHVLEKYPEMAGVNIMVPADSLFSDDGTRGGQVGISPVPPDRLPGPLPPGLEFPVVITVQTDGPTNFDRPVPACFPNLPDPVTGQPLLPGTKNGLFSFNHDKGYWEYMGPMTVSADGTTICTDPGVGIVAPGWHGAGPPPVSPPPPPCPNPPCECVPEAGAFAGLSTQLSLTTGNNQTLDLASCLEDCQAKLQIAVTNATLTFFIGSIACFVAFHFNPIVGIVCFAVLWLNYNKDLYTADKNHEQCVKNCKNQNCNSPAALTSRSVIPLQEDIVFEEIRKKVEEIGEIVTTFDISDMGAAQQKGEQIQLLFDSGNQVAGGNVEEYLTNRILELEAKGIPLEHEVGVDPGNAPPYSVLYAAEIQRGTDTLYLRGATQSFGQYQLFVPRDGILRQILFYDSRSHSYGTVFPRLHPESLYPLPALTLIPVVGAPLPDSDKDGLADHIEIVYGSDINNPDTDGDGISDKAEVDQGLDPLGGRVSRTGVISSADTPGNAVDIDAFNDQAVLADSDGGITVFNVFNGMNPTIIAEVNTPGNARSVACAENLIAVADGTAGLALIDMTNPPDARILRQIPLGGSAESVAVGAGVAYVGLDTGFVVSIDMTTGILLDRVSVSKKVQDLKLGTDYLYVLTQGQLHTFKISEGSISFMGSTPSPGDSSVVGRRQRLFVGSHTLYATHIRGYNTFSLADPSLPTLLEAGVTTQLGWKQIVDNGSGLGVAAAGPNVTDDGPHEVQLYDVKDPAQTNLFLTQFDTPGIAEAISLYNGLAYVADGLSGMQVINYLPYDALKVVPAITLQTDAPDRRVEEGKPLRITADVSDDVQVRNVEFYIDGNHFATDGNYPFEYRFTAPLLINQTTFTLQARASDTGGNVTFTETFAFTVTPDSTPPRVKRTTPGQGGILGSVTVLSALFNEPLNPSTVRPETFRILAAGPDGISGNADDVPINSGAVTYNEDTQTAYLTFPSKLEPGLYRGQITAPLADLIGNALASDIGWTFRVFSQTDNDQDGVPDEIEPLLGLDPTKFDSDGDGMIDGMEDFDQDRLPNSGEIILELDPTNPDTDNDTIFDGDEDADLDDLSNGREIELGTDPLLADSDGDIWPDGIELITQGDPLDPKIGSRLYQAQAKSIDVVAQGIGATNQPSNVYTARPPVTVLLPAMNTPGALPTNTIAARPRVMILLPNLGEAGELQLNPISAHPPVSVLLPNQGQGDSFPPNPSFASPPIYILLPNQGSPEDTPSNLTVGKPPVQVKIEPQGLSVGNRKKASRKN